MLRSRFLVMGCLLIAVSLLVTYQTSPAGEMLTSASSALVGENDWEILDTGLERRITAPEGQPLSAVVVLRIDPQAYDFRAHYRPGAPMWINEWRDTLPESVALVNANFFDRDNRIQGLLVADGVRYGESYTWRGGTFAVYDGNIFIESNRQRAFQNTLLDQAVQAFPMLVQNGTATYTNTREDRVSRRTAVGQDSEGRVLLMATTLFGMRLTDWSAFLAESDLDLVNAFNLDGGGSTMMMIASDDYTLSSFDAVPAVLAVYPRTDVTTE